MRALVRLLRGTKKRFSMARLKAQHHNISRSHPNISIETTTDTTTEPNCMLSPLFEAHLNQTGALKQSPKNHFTTNFHQENISRIALCSNHQCNSGLKDQAIPSFDKHYTFEPSFTHDSHHP